MIAELSLGREVKASLLKKWIDYQERTQHVAQGYERYKADKEIMKYLRVISFNIHLGWEDIASHNFLQYLVLFKIKYWKIILVFSEMRYYTSLFENESLSTFRKMFFREDVRSRNWLRENVRKPLRKDFISFKKPLYKAELDIWPRFKEALWLYRAELGIFLTPEEPLYIERTRNFFKSQKACRASIYRRAQNFSKSQRSFII